MFQERKRTSETWLRVLIIHVTSGILAVSSTSDVNNGDLQVSIRDFERVCFHWYGLIKSSTNSELFINLCTKEEFCFSLNASLMDGERCVSLKHSRIKPYETYNASVVLKGRELATEEFSTPPLYPGKPENFTCSFKDSEVYFNWIAPKEPNGPIDGYTLNFWNESGSNVHVHVSNNNYSCNATKLPRNFLASVEAFNRYKQILLLGEKENAVNPGKPEYFAYSFKGEVVEFNWQPSIESSSSVDGYILTFTNQTGSGDHRHTQNFSYTCNATQLPRNFDAGIQAYMMYNGMELLGEKVIGMNPGKPEMFTYSFENKEIEFIWNPPVKSSGSVDGYILTFTNQTGYVNQVHVGDPSYICNASELPSNFVASVQACTMYRGSQLLGEHEIGINPGKPENFTYFLKGGLVKFRWQHPKGTMDIVNVYILNLTNHSDHNNKSIYVANTRYSCATDLLPLNFVSSVRAHSLYHGKNLYSKEEYGIKCPPEILNFVANSTDDALLLRWWAKPSVHYEFRLSYFHSENKTVRSLVLSGFDKEVLLDDILQCTVYTIILTPWCIARDEYFSGEHYVLGQKTGGSGAGRIQKAKDINSLQHEWTIILRIVSGCILCCAFLFITVSFLVTIVQFLTTKERYQYLLDLQKKMCQNEYDYTTGMYNIISEKLSTEDHNADDNIYEEILNEDED